MIRHVWGMHERAYDQPVAVVEWNVGKKSGKRARNPQQPFTDFSPCGETHLSVVLVVQRGEVYRRRLGHHLDGVCVLHVRDGVLGDLRLHDPNTPLRSGPNRSRRRCLRRGPARYRLPLRLENGPI